VSFVQLRTPHQPLPVGTVWLRDPQSPCTEYDGKGYDGTGHCQSDGHYECLNCSQLAPDAPRFDHG